MRQENTLLLQKLARMERRVRGEAGVDEIGVSSASPRKRSRDRGESADKIFKKRKTGSSLEVSGVTVVSEEKIERGSSWSGQDKRGTSNDIEAYDHREDELTDEFIGDSEHTLASEQMEKMSEAARPDTPASVTSEDNSAMKLDVAPRSSKRPRKVTESSGRKLTSGKSQSPAMGERSQLGKTRRSKSGLNGMCNFILDDNKENYLGPPPEPVQMLECHQLYYVGCKNDNLSCAEDQLCEVPALQRGVEVRIFNVKNCISFHFRPLAQESDCSCFSLLCVARWLVCAVVTLLWLLGAKLERGPKPLQPVRTN